MKKRTKFLVAVTLGIGLFITTGTLKAQSLDDIGTAYNSALELQKTDLGAAVTSMLSVVDMCDKLGAEADALKANAVKVIPDWQYSIANGLLKDKNFDLAIPAFEKTIEYATRFNDSDKLEKAKTQLPKVLFSKGNALSKAEDYDGAIGFFDRAIGMDPEYAKAFLMKGQALKKKGDSEGMKTALDKAIEFAGKTNDTATVGNAKKLMGGDFLSRANTAFKAKNYNSAIELATSAIQYTPSTSAYLILAVSNNSVSKFDAAIEAARKGIELETAADKISDFNFQIGKAYEGKKDTKNACAAYKKVTSGPNKAAADYQIKTVLKCQ